jgi:RHS repeat-associated protein
MDRAYEYDDAGNVTRVADSPGSSAPNDTQCFRYDHLRRLTQAWTPASTAWWNCLVNPQAGSLGGVGPYWHSWTYDPTGNRLTETRHATGGDTVSTYEYPTPGSPRPHAVTGLDTTGPGGSTSNSYTYDDAGNLTERTIDGATQDLTFDAEGQVAEVTDATGATSFVYDADGNRLIRRDPGGKTLYLEGQELRWDAGSGVRSCTRYYAHEGTSIAVRTSAGVTWLVTDHHNTGEVAVRGSDMLAVTRRSLPFGGQRGTAPVWWAGDKGFVGGTQDPSGLVHLGARLYDPDLGRFISVDPIMDLADPQQMQGYAYTNSNPLTWSDPEGLVCTPDAYNLCPGQNVRLQPAGRPKPPKKPGTGAPDSQEHLRPAPGTPKYTKAEQDAESLSSRLVGYAVTYADLFGVPARLVVALLMQEQPIYANSWWWVKELSKRYINQGGNTGGDLGWERAGNASVGAVQMKPRTAQRLLRRIGYGERSIDGLRKELLGSDEFAVYLATLHLKLDLESGMTSKEAYLSYSLSPEQARRLMNPSDSPVQRNEDLSARSARYDANMYFLRMVGLEAFYGVEQMPSPRFGYPGIIY